jgi:alpha-glucosidase
MLSWYRTLIRERRSSVALRRGSYRALESRDGIYAYLREADGERRLVVLNFWGRPLRVPIPVDLAGSARIVLSSDPDRDAGQIGRSVIVGADEGLLLAV